MNTPTHLLIGAAALAAPRTATGDRWRNPAIVLFALLPDLGLFVLFVWARLIQGASEQVLWDDIYWEDHWQTLFAIGNSVPLYLALLIAGLVLRATRLGRLIIVAACAALLHLAFDLPVHADDAHRHFWPISDWRFHSPISYWDPDHHGDTMTAIEIALGLALSVILWRRFPSRIVRGCLVGAMTLYVAVPAYFTVMLGD